MLGSILFKKLQVLQTIYGWQLKHFDIQTI